MFRFPLLLALAVIFMPSAAHALNEGLQCVPYARALTGVEIRGDAHTWWGQAKGRYKRGSRPKVGAVVSFKKHGNSRYGHVAAVRKIVDSRTVLISHANWSRINGKRGHVEENVKMVDASKNNDWSQVRVWYTPNKALGGTKRPLDGFIYPHKKLSDAQAKRRLTALLGKKAKLTPVPGNYSKAPVRMAAAKPTPRLKNAAASRKMGAFTLSNKALTEVNRTSARELASNSPRPTPARHRDAIGDLLGSLGS